MGSYSMGGLLLSSRVRGNSRRGFFEGGGNLRIYSMPGLSLFHFSDLSDCAAALIERMSGL